MNVFYRNLACAVWVDTAMVEQPSSDKHDNAVEQLENGRLIDDRHVEHAVIRHGAWGLSVAAGISNTYRHHFAFDGLRVDFQVHGVVHPLEDKQDE